MSEPERVELERRFSLDGGQISTPPSTWIYELRDPSPQNVEALVRHPQVEDTHHIDRSRFVVEYESPRLDDPVLGAEFVTPLKYPGTGISIAAVLFIGVIAFILPAAVMWRNRGLLRLPLGRGPIKTLGACAALIVPFAWWTARPALSPVLMTPMAPSGVVHTTQEMIAAAPCLTRATMQAPFSADLMGGEPLVLFDVYSCPPTQALIAWMAQHVPENAVLAINRWNQYLPTVFVTPQVVVFPGAEPVFANERLLFEKYYAFYERTIRTYGTQPFFNAIERSSDRAVFLRTLGVTHVLVDPAYYFEMRRVLDGLPELVKIRYADGRWAVYEVQLAAEQPRGTY